jgi:hypothetical protein
MLAPSMIAFAQDTKPAAPQFVRLTRLDAELNALRQTSPPPITEEWSEPDDGGGGRLSDSYGAAASATVPPPPRNFQTSDPEDDEDNVDDLLPPPLPHIDRRGVPAALARPPAGFEDNTGPRVASPSIAVSVLAEDEEIGVDDAGEALGCVRLIALLSYGYYSYSVCELVSLH